MPNLDSMLMLPGRHHRWKIVGRVAALALIAGVAGRPVLASTPEVVTAVTTVGVEWRWDVQIPLRDGIHLSAIAYLPAGQARPRPCIFTLTPYTAQSYHDRGVYFASHGYAFLSVDVRGLGNSEGEFRPLI